MFDSAFAKPTIFKRLFKKANLTHIRHNYKFGPTTEDEQIYNLATRENRIVITQDNDFKKWVKEKGAGAFILPAYLSNKQIDGLLVDYIVGKDPEDFRGKATKIP